MSALLRASSDQTSASLTSALTLSFQLVDLWFIDLTLSFTGPLLGFILPNMSFICANSVHPPNTGLHHPNYGPYASKHGSACLPNTFLPISGIHLLTHRISLRYASAVITAWRCTVNAKAILSNRIDVIVRPVIDLRFRQMHEVTVPVFNRVAQVSAWDLRRPSRNWESVWRKNRKKNQFKEQKYKQSPEGLNRVRLGRKCIRTQKCDVNENRRIDKWTQLARTTNTFKS